MTKPLDGIRVLDLSRILAGPWSAQLLADLGADVIKVERPGTGDDTRQWGPPFLMDADGNETGESSYYLAANRGKRSITLNLASEEGRNIVRQLAASSDVLVENFKVGDLASKGLGYDDLRKDNPGLIYLSITGFGQNGPRASQPGYDYLAQSMGGLMSITGRADDEDGAGPMRTGVAVADLSTAMYGTVGVLSAIIHRSNTGVGQHIDMALLDTQVTMLANQALYYLVGGTPPARSGGWHPSLAPYQPFASADEPFIVACGNDGQFVTLCTFIGRAELATDPRFVTNPDRNAHRQELAAELEAEFVKQPRAYWLDELPKQGVPCSAVNSIADVFEEPQVIARNMRIEVPNAAAGTAPGVANPIKFSETPLDYPVGPPTLGEHTDEVLSERLDLDADAIADLRARNVV